MKAAGNNRGHSCIWRAFLSILLFIPVLTSGQEGALDEYIRMGLENNLSIRKATLEYEKNLTALNEARGYFLPGLSINARYTIARGGRTFDFPAGDMLNPLFQNINALNAAMAAINPLFPSLPPYPSAENITFRFYRPREHETKASLIQPIYNPQIIYNYRIKKVEVGMGLKSLDITSRSLVKQITDAYYDFMRAVEYQQLATEILSLATENLRVCGSLHENGLITRDVVLRAEADLAAAGVAIAESEGSVNSARAYFNYLLRRELNEPVVCDTITILALPAESLTESIGNAATRRPETALVNDYIEANRNIVAMNRAEALPVVAGAVDYGFQGEKYSFSSDDDFMLASLVLRWNISSGSTARNKIRQAKIDHEMLEVAREDLENRIELQTITAYYDMMAAYEAARAAATAVLPAAEAFRITGSRFREGEVAYATLLEVQTRMVEARRKHLDSRYTFMKEKCAFNLATGNISAK